MTNPIFSTYKSLATEFYDLEDHRDGARALPLFMAYAHAAPGPILEPMCGTGRFLIPIVQAGYDIEGFDASASMLAALRMKYAQFFDTQPPIWQSFIQDFASEKRYSLIFVPYGSWGLITDKKESQQALALMYQHLATKGRLVIEIETVHSVPMPCNVWRRGTHQAADGSLIIIDAFPTFDPKTQLYHALCHYEKKRDGTCIAKESENFTMYLYDFNEFDVMLSAAGFENIRKYQDHIKTPAADKTSPLLLYECIKN